MVHDLRALLRTAQGREPEPTAVILEGRTMRSTPESGHRAGYDGHKRRKGYKVHAAVDTLGHSLTVRVTPANGDRHPSILSAVSTATRAYVEVTRGATLEVQFAELEAMLREQVKEDAA